MAVIAARWHGINASKAGMRCQGFCSLLLQQLVLL